MINNLTVNCSIYDIDISSKTPKYQQIVHSITKSPKLGLLKKGDRLLSVNELSNEFLVSRNTVQKAYEILEKDGILIDFRGKGFYIKRMDIKIKFRILLVFNKMINYKKLVYNAFINTIADKGTVDLKIYHFSTDLFGNYILSNLGEYDYYIIIPHFYENITEAFSMIKNISSNKLILLDKDIEYMPGNYSAVYQDFMNVIVQALEDGWHLIRKYNRLNLVFPKITKYQKEILTGFKIFCCQKNIIFQILEEIDSDTYITEKVAFVIIEETDLVNLIIKCNQLNFIVGKHIGIISYKDTALKEILFNGITVISTDHAKIGESAARIILENKKAKIKTHFHLL